MTKDDDSKNATQVGTRVDLGDDLLAKTAVGIVAPKKSESQLSPQLSNELSIDHEPQDFSGEIQVSDGTDETDEDDALVNARILIAEGMLADAKKTLRQELILRPGNLTIQKLLDELNAQELKRLMSSDVTKASSSYEKRRDKGSERVLESLEHDYHLGLFEKADARDLPTELDAAETKNLSARDRIDLGVAHLELELYSHACVHFEVAQSKCDTNSQDFLSAVSLLVQARVLMKAPFEALSAAQVLIRDTERNFQEKFEVFYWVARAYEQLENPALAFQWYEQVFKTNPLYRDVDARIHSLKK